MTQLVDRLWTSEVLQTVDTQRLEADAFGQVILHQIEDRLGEEGLSPMGQRSQTSTPVDRGGVVVAFLLEGDAGVKRTADADGSVRRPGFLVQRDLEGEGS